MPKLDTHDIDVMAGAIYFVVGVATEGGDDSYRLSIAGIGSTTDTEWGKVESVKADSGYSLGAIQVDLGQRGTWALGSTNGTALKPGEQSYVDAIIDQAAKFAKERHLDFPKDKTQLRADLLTHGNGQDGRGAIVFLEADTFETFNAWASSELGQPWIHRNIDYPQIRHATQSAMDLLDKYGKNVSEDRRFEAIAILAKTANQMPSKLKSFEKILKDGGDYDDLLAEASKTASRYGYYAGLKAAAVAGKYEDARKNPEVSMALDRAQAKVTLESFNPSTASADVDVQEALRAIGRGRPIHVLRRGSHGDQVAALQIDLTKLGFTDAHGLVLHPDGAFGPGTQAAVEAFQRAHDLKPDGIAGPQTLRILHEATRQQAASLADGSHPGHSLFCQALEGVKAIDARHGRASDAVSAKLAGSLAAAAYAEGLARIDHVILGEGAARAFAVQGDPRSPLRRMACVDVVQAINTPLVHSSGEFLAVSRLGGAQRQGADSPLPFVQPSPDGLSR
jgi:hypothetical protein